MPPLVGQRPVTLQCLLTCFILPQCSTSMWLFATATRLLVLRPMLVLAAHFHILH
jgi:hypothetical protein